MEQTLNSLTQAFGRLSERERRIVVVGAIAALVVLVIGVVLPLQRSVSVAEQRIERKRDDLAWLRSMAPRLGATPISTPQPLRESLDPEPARDRRNQRDARVGHQPLIVKNDPSLVQHNRLLIMHHLGDLLTPGPGCP